MLTFDRLKAIVSVSEKLKELGISSALLNDVIDELVRDKNHTIEQYKPNYDEDYSKNCAPKVVFQGDCYRLFKNGNKWKTGSILHHNKSGVTIYKYGIPGMFKHNNHFYILKKYAV